ncbi:MAG: sugar transferase, partial [Lachnospiraceae bacterium]|nr:sugar transferase [Lachnospiraceae bacterium]
MWWLMLIIALLIKLDSKGPVIFKQRRPGYKKQIFTMYKFRTMKVETMDGDRKLSDDERTTKLGKFLRKSSLDELPQLFNILKGEVALIGPRALLINDIPTYTEDQLKRFEVLPGMTSWNAVQGRNDNDLQTKYNNEVYYVEHFGPMIDIKIFLRPLLSYYPAKVSMTKNEELRRILLR